MFDFIALFKMCRCNSSCNEKREKIYKDEMKELRHDIKNTLHIMKFLIDEKPIHDSEKQELHKNVDSLLQVIETKIHLDYIKKLKKR